MDLPITQEDLDSLPQPIHRRGLSSFVKAGVSLLITANVDMLVAFSTSYWTTWNKASTTEHGGYGLWKIWKCTKHITSDGVDVEEVEICTDRMADLSFPAWYVTTQVFMTLALAGFLASLVLLLLYMFLPSCNRNRTAMSTLIGISYLSGLFLVVGLVVFSVKVSEEIEEMAVTEWFLSWSFSLACTAFVLNQIAASLLITEGKRLHRSEYDHGQTVSDFKDDMKTVLTKNERLTDY